MKPRKPQNTPSEFTSAILRAGRRAAKAARKVARAHGTPVYYMKDGKIVAEKP